MLEVSLMAIMIHMGSLTSILRVLEAISLSTSQARTSQRWIHSIQALYPFFHPHSPPPPDVGHARKAQSTSHELLNRDRADSGVAYTTSPSMAGAALIASPTKDPIPTPSGDDVPAESYHEIHDRDEHVDDTSLSDTPDLSDDDRWQIPASVLTTSSEIAL